MNPIVQAYVESYDLPDLREMLREVDRTALNAVESTLPYRNFLVIGKVRLGPAKDAAAQEGAFSVTWEMTVPVQF